ncbi:MAG: ABC transporter ATP-binding protein [Candidatus Lambdaproteobacteria bacterium]|nr:ABC transporter ATP-binding protein [Candidatus Lambdaproteobacteria bacterium]
MTVALEINNLEVVYHGAIQALNGLSLQVPEGEIVALLGANGAGKSTTLKAISGFLPLEGGKVTHGTIQVGGADILGTAPHLLVRSGIVQVREGRHVFADMTVEDNLVAATYATVGRPAARRHAFDEVYSYFPILAERRKQNAGYLSGGEQQMLVIGRALVAQPRLILFDEPSLGLAPMIVAEIFEIIRKISREKEVSMLIVEQNATAALRTASYGYVIENGRAVIDGRAEDLVQNKDIREFYLGISEHGADRQDFREAQRRKPVPEWLA